MSPAPGELCLDERPRDTAVFEIMAAERLNVQQALYYKSSTMMIIWGATYLLMGVAERTWGLGGEGMTAAGAVLCAAAIVVAAISLVHSCGVDARSIRRERAATVGAMSLIFLIGAGMVITRGSGADVLRVGAFGSMMVLMLWVASGVVLGKDMLRGLVAVCVIPTIVAGFAVDASMLGWVAIGGGVLALALVWPVKRAEWNRWRRRRAPDYGLAR